MPPPKFVAIRHPVDGGGTIGLNHNTSFNAFEPQFAVANFGLYAVWAESNGTADQIRVRVYDGTSWKFVDGGTVKGINADPNQSADLPSIISVNNKLYITWREMVSSHQIRISTYDTQKQVPAWQFLDGGGAYGLNQNPLLEAGNPQLVLLNGTFFVGWEEIDPSNPNGSIVYIKSGQ